MMYDIVASIVVFKSDKELLIKAIESFLKAKLNTYLYVIDNSPTPEIGNICVFRNVEYVFNNNNLGFGAGHNISMRKMIQNTKYFLILNPDVYFCDGTLEKLYSFMEENKDAGLTLPKVLYPDGSLQYLCRLLPDPYDILLRKINFKILNSVINKRKARYELKFADYNKPMQVPYLSGCFMFIRAEALKKSGLFDERFFIYFEDVDLSRRINQYYRNVYFPEVAIYHGYEKGSNKSFKLFKYLIVSGIKYFNKWGWFFDKERSLVNRKALEMIQA